jgi:G:T-mismatch repair DNA endonuclease (very short patch repair protein)
MKGNQGNHTKGPDRKSSGMKGKHHSDATKLKMKLSKIGKYDGADNPNFGNHPSEDGKRRMRLANKIFWGNKKLSDPVRENIRIGTANQIISRITVPEKKVFEYLDSRDIFYFPHCYLMSVFGTTPFKWHRFDAVLPNQQILIEVQGCYWHGCKDCFHTFNELQLHNIERDEDIRRVVRDSGWTLVELWEHDIKENKLILPEEIL